MAATLNFFQSGLPVVPDNQSREDIIPATVVAITNVNPVGPGDALYLLWKPPEDDTAAIIGSSPNWTLTPKAGTWGTYRFLLVLENGDMILHTFDTLEPPLNLPSMAAMETADPTASLIKNTATEINRSESNTPFGPFTSGSAWGWWWKPERWRRKLNALFHAVTGHTHTGAGENGPQISHGDVASVSANQHHNEAHQLDPSGGPHTGALPESDVTFGDAGHAHGSGADGATVAHSDLNDDQAEKHRLINDSGSSTTELFSAQRILGLVDATLKPPEAFAPAGNYPTTYGGNPVEQGDTFRITSAGTMGGITVNIEDLLICLVDAPGQTDANWMVAESNRDQATETVKGVAELATQAEADAGTDDTRIITPLKMATAPVNQHPLDSTSEHSAPTDNTNFDADASKHGFMPKLPNDAKLFANGAGGFTFPDVDWQAPVVDPVALALQPNKGYMIVVTAPGASVILPGSLTTGDRIPILFQTVSGDKLNVSSAGSIATHEPFGILGSSVDLVQTMFTAIVGLDTSGAGGPAVLWFILQWMAGVDAKTSPGVVTVEGGIVDYQGLGTHSIPIRQSADALESLAWSDNSIMVKAGSADVAPLVLPAKSIYVRKETGEIVVLTLSADNSIFGSSAGVIIEIPFLDNRLLGMEAGGTLGAVTGKATIQILRKGGSFTQGSLSEAPTITFDASALRLNTSTNLTANRNFDFVNMLSGDSGFISIRQGTAGGHQLTFKREGNAANVHYAGGVGPVLTNGVNALDIIRYYDDGAITHVTVFSLDSK